MVQLKNKIVASLCAFMIVATQAASVIDVQDMMLSAMYQSDSLYHKEDAIKAIIREKINDRDDIAAIERMLCEFKEEFLRKKKSISPADLDAIHESLTFGAGVSVFSGAVASAVSLFGVTYMTTFFWLESLAHTYPDFNAKLIPALEKLFKRAMPVVNGVFTLDKNRPDQYGFIGTSLLVAGASFSVAAYLCVMSKMFKDSYHKQSNIVSSIQSIDNLLEYLHFHKGLAAGSQDR